MPDGRAAQSRVIGCRITGFRSRARVRARLEGLIQQVNKHTIDGEIPEKRHPQLARECPDAQARYVFFGSPGFRHGPEERSGMEGAFQSHGCSGAVMGVQEIRQTFLGIDFSGNHLKWRTDRTSNVLHREGPSSRGPASLKHASNSSGASRPGGTLPEIGKATESEGLRCRRD
jgi:hypothetical protein